MTTKADIAEAVQEFATFVGVDLHKTTVTLVAVDAARQVVGRLKTDTKCVGAIDRFLGGLPGKVWMAVEAVGFAEWFIDRFRPAVQRIDIADATELARLRGKRRKTDWNDAADIAHRLSRGECPLGYIASPEEMTLRKLGRHWRRLSRTIARAKHGMKSMLNAANIRGPKFDGASAHKWLLAHGELLMPVQREAFEDLLDIVLLIERQKERLRRRIIVANRSEAFAGIVGICKSVPGIDEIWGCIITAEVGPFDRFPNADAVEFWSGLTPDTKESAGRTQSGKITKAGPATLRWALGMAAMNLGRSDQAWKARRERLVRQIGKPKANVAMARRLLRTLYAMMRDSTAFEKSQSTGHPARANQARAARRAAKAQPRGTPRPSAAAFFAPRPQAGARAQGAKNAPRATGPRGVTTGE